ncbi:thiosulfate sulfurtransferase [Maudiozyma barnettii]|uniref:Sulfurtransferase n=1 Tax=Maudiozyma barnettii TaxID=61262 RepID=A0A8H2VCS1_9SACH|nr:thiosulfate sulfurtransferase [Kazachstania barnettii]CAB4252891.1 similar to Saccharomyces cerevisiae YOR251C TUM1 Rhodanese domain sulfur transferase [Kazachstania barnettii]
MSLYKLITPKKFVELVAKETTRRVVPVDSTWYMPNLNKDAKAEFKDLERIQNAVYFDIDGIKDTKSPYPHMVPDLETFNKGMSQLGLKRDDILVVYDRIGNFSAPRCAWTIGLFEHPNVYLLNNFNLYKGAGYPLDTSKKESFSEYPVSDYHADSSLAIDEVVPYENIVDLVQSGDIRSKYNLVDARALDRFEGKVPEPRPDIPSGHVPGANPLPFGEVLNDGAKTFPESTEEMASRIDQVTKKLGYTIDPKKPTIAMCGTGVTGTIIKTALEHAGFKMVRLYDGSWTEWALRSGSELIAKNRD